MVYRNFPRILVGSCTKCGGALREQEDPGEWMCINCGRLVLSTPVREPIVQSEPIVVLSEGKVAGVTEEVEVAEEASSVLLNRLEEEEQEGDDQEWEKLVTSHTTKIIGRHEFSVCKECGKKGSYTYGTDLNTVYCKYCSPRNPWKGI